MQRGLSAIAELLVFSMKLLHNHLNSNRQSEPV